MSNKKNDKNLFQAPEIESKTIEALSAQLLAAHNKLNAMQAARKRMLSNISHDLRAPITAIRSAVDYVQSNPNMSLEDIRKSVDLIDRRSKVLENLVQDMYYYMCVEDSTLQLKFECIEAAPFFETYYYDLFVDSKYDNHELLFDMPDNMPGFLKVDVQKMVRALDNLFGNAAKYTPAGSFIKLTVHPDETGKFLHIYVTDNGPGVSAEHLPHIFESTYTVSDARTPNSISGSGLGLAIVKSILQRHGGRITCSSELGNGCSFHMILPLYTSIAEAQGAQFAAEEEEEQ